MEKFAFKDWLEASGLTEATQEVLKTEALTSDRALMSVTPEELNFIELPLGQRGLLRQAVSLLHADHGHPPMTEHNKTPGGPESVTMKTTRDLSQDPELNQLVQQLGDCHLKDILNTAQPALSGPGKGERPLLITDFIKQPKGVYNIEDCDEVFAGSMNSHLVVRTRRKPALDQVSLAQWVSANCRILLRLIEHDQAPLTAIKDYLEYSAEVGDLCQTYTTSSVMLLDNAHRIRQHQQKTPWNDSDRHSRDFYLEKKITVSNANKQTNNIMPKASMKRRPVDSQGRNICLGYNNQQTGCTHPNCNYQHVCAAAGCGGPHPQHQHDSMPPRFRTQT